jgi:ceramide glucosyltransferase
VSFAGLILCPAYAYQVLAIAGAVLHLRRRKKECPARYQPPVTILKPVRGLDPNTSEAFFSQAAQDYPEFEILFGVQSEQDPAIPAIRGLQDAFPNVPIRLVVCGKSPALNAKVGVLAELSRHARNPVWVVNDADICVGRDYLSQVVWPLADGSVGVVTCPYRAHADSLPTAWEALGIATDFIPSALVARMLGVREFGFGSTLAFRAEDLAAAGGFASFSDFLADDYQLAKRISSLGKNAVLSTYSVETSLGEGSWYGVWLHQVRWAKTIRASKGWGHLGLPITHAGLWMIVGLGVRAPIMALVLFGLRISSAFITSRFVLNSKADATRSWLAPFWDCYAFCVWIASYLGRTVKWRDRLLRIGKEGVILE